MKDSERVQNPENGKGLVGKKCKVINCNKPATIHRGGIPLCSVECIRRQQEDSSATTPVNTGRKNKADHLSPPDVDLLKKKQYESLEDANSYIGVLKEHIAELELELQRTRDELQLTKSELVTAKIAIADKVIAQISKPASRTIAEVVKSGDSSERAVLSATSSKRIDIRQIDELLKSSKSGPTALNVVQREDRVLITFNDRSSRDEAKRIIENTQAGKDLFSQVSERNNRYPVIVKFVNLEEEQNLELLNEVKMRNPTFQDQMLSCAVIFRSRDKNVGHLKLWLASIDARNNIIKEGGLYFLGTRCRVVLPDPHRDVLRCLKCQKYGHQAKRCPKSEPTCATCNGSHFTASCPNYDNSEKLQCCNCAVGSDGSVNVRKTSNHRAGSKECPAQLAAIERYKKLFRLN